MYTGTDTQGLLPTAIARHLQFDQVFALENFQQGGRLAQRLAVDIDRGADRYAGDSNIGPGRLQFHGEGLGLLHALNFY